MIDKEALTGFSSGSKSIMLAIYLILELLHFKMN
jgi:hypothetical protein